jgi:hypothetical protein
MKNLFDAILLLLEQFIKPQSSIYQFYSFFPYRDQIYLLLTMIAEILTAIGFLIFIFVYSSEHDLPIISSVVEMCAGASVYIIASSIGGFVIVCCCCLFALSVNFNIQNTAQVKGIIQIAYSLILFLKISSAYAAFRFGQWFINRILLGILSLVISSIISFVIILLGINFPLIAFLLLIASCIAFFKDLVTVLEESSSISQGVLIILSLGFALLVLMSAIVEPEAMLHLEGRSDFNSQALWFLMTYYFLPAVCLGLIVQLARKGITFHRL